MKYLNAKIPNGNIAMIEQKNSVYSTVYAIRGNIDISTEIGQYTLPHGQKIAISASIAQDTATKLSDEARSFDEGIKTSEIFVRNNGIQHLMNQAKKSGETNA